MTSLSDQLRAEVWNLIGNKPVGVVAAEMGISRWTLWRFLRGAPADGITLDRIDRWARRFGNAPK